jgi:hypothetical protein
MLKKYQETWVKGDIF